MNINPYVTIRQSKIHGRGIFASVKIPTGTEIIQYVGEKITKAESEKRAATVLQRAKESGSGAVYIFTLDDEYDIDGNVPWNTARLINHACITNCEAQIIDDEIWIVATKMIKKGEPLHYDYGYDMKDWENHPCRCGADKCIGYIVEKKYHQRLLRLKRYKQLRAAKSRRKNCS